MNNATELRAKIDNAIAAEISRHCPNGKWITGPATLHLAIGEAMEALLTRTEAGAGPEPCYCVRCHPTLGSAEATPPATAPCQTDPRLNAAPVADGVIEQAAILLWHRFAPEDHIEWEDDQHQAEYRMAASAVLALAHPQDASAGDGFYIATFKHKDNSGAVTWWGPNDAGYTPDLATAGIYTEITPGYHENEYTVPVPVSFIKMLRVREVVDPGDSLNKAFWSANHLRCALAALQQTAGGGRE